jgi:hypothetical protein
VGCFLFIRPLGLAGAGLALLLSNVVDIFYFVISLREFLRMSVIGLLRTAYLKPLLLALLLAIPAVAIRPLAASWLGLMFCVSSYLLLYASIAYRIDIFGKTEKQAILGLWGSLRTALSV